MFTKILIAEDHGTTVRGLQVILPQSLGIHEIFITNYCDVALLKIKTAHLKNEPFELLISNLSFTTNGNIQNLQSGIQLIEAIRNLNINTKIIVLSSETKIGIIKELYERQLIDGFVVKGPNEINDLLKAIKIVYTGKIYTSNTISMKLFQFADLIEISKYDKLLIKLCAEGYTNLEIAEYLKKNQITPNALRTIELHFNSLKIILQVRTTVQLISKAKDLGII
ncbi:response regulator [Leeuwenhoekiella sp. A2]|uniref:response regulator n=1 Tax=Leeuwenhoekiella sp. A2 TaxID=3141460 RepID=UPI003A800C40